VGRGLWDAANGVANQPVHYALLNDILQCFDTADVFLLIKTLSTKRFTAPII
jgi:hypothetical protein